MLHQINSLAKATKFFQSKAFNASVFWCFLILILASVFYRITIGIDLSDEAYYATFLDAWLKAEIRNSPNLALHQTAALLIFPFAYGYKMLAGSEVGLILFLRALYVFVSLSASLTLYFFIKKLQGKQVGVLVLAYCMVFIPFSLPALSYNTLGMFGMLAAISLFGIAALRITPVIASINDPLPYGLMTASAGCWAIATIAYISLITVLWVLLWIAYVLMCYSYERDFIKRYALICLLFQICSIVLVFLFFGFEHLLQMFKFSFAALQVNNGLLIKLAKTKFLFAQNPTFSFFCLLFFIAGISIGFVSAKRWLRLIIVACGSSLIIYNFMLHKLPALFAYSHDLVVMLALLGVFIPVRALRERQNTGKMQIVSVMYCGSIAAGLITAATASNAMINFPIGGMLASCLCLAFIFPDKITDQLQRIIHCGLLLTACFMMSFFSYSFIYGESYGNPLIVPAVRMHGTVFSGLYSSKDNAAIIQKIIEILPPRSLVTQKVMVIGRLSGIYLLTPAVSSALTTWNFGAKSGADAQQMIKAFYHNPKNRPDFMVKSTDRWTEPLTELETQLTLKYFVAKHITIGDTTVTLYKKPLIATKSTLKA